VKRERERGGEGIEKNKESVWKEQKETHHNERGGSGNGTMEGSFLKLFLLFLIPGRWRERWALGLVGLVGPGHHPIGH